MKKDRKTYTFTPLSPQYVREKQLKLKKEDEMLRASEAMKENTRDGENETRVEERENKKSVDKRKEHRVDGFGSIRHENRFWARTILRRRWAHVLRTILRRKWARGLRTISRRRWAHGLRTILR